MEFSAIFKELRLEGGYSQAEISKALKVKRATVSHWEVGRIEPSIAVLKNIADFFDVSLDYLCGRTDNSSSDIDFYIPAQKQKSEYQLLYESLSSSMQEKAKTFVQSLSKTDKD